MLFALVLSCNGSKANTEWQEWYLNQEFFQEVNKRKIQDWIGHHEDGKVKLYRYKPRRKFYPRSCIILYKN